MANFTALKTAINNAIKTNGNEEITGAILQAILDAMVETLGDSAINDLENAITTEVTNRENAVGGVADDLAAEALARANKDNHLDGRINQEEYNRQNADAALSQTMSQGFQTLGSQMTALNAAISALNAAYQNGYLYGGIATPSSSPSNNKCFYIALQGGTYTNFGGVGVVEGINIIKNDSGWKVEHIYDQTTLLNEFYLLRQQVIQAITSFAPIVIEGDVTNAPDEEDLTSNAQHLLQFKNNAFNPIIFSGMGKVFLRKNLQPLSESYSFDGFVEGVTAQAELLGTPDQIFWDRTNEHFVGLKDGVYYLAWTDDDAYVPTSESNLYIYDGNPYRWNGSEFYIDSEELPNIRNVLTQNMINEANTIYIIRYDFTLTENITIPANCVLEFDGGSIGGTYTITGTNTNIAAEDVCIFKNQITIAGTWNCKDIYSTWFSDITQDNRLKQLVNFTNANITNNVYIRKGDYIVSALQERDNIIVLNSNTNLYLEGTIKLSTNAFEHFNIIYAVDAENITICGDGAVYGDAKTHDYSSGNPHEWGINVLIQTSRNVRISGISVYDSIGDGIDVGGHDIIVENFYAENCCRQATGNYSKIFYNCIWRNFTIKDCIGHVYQPERYGFGISLEIDHLDGYIRDIEIYNGVIINCHQPIVAFNHNIESIEFNGIKVSNVTIKDCTDENAQFPFNFDGVKNGIVNNLYITNCRYNIQVNVSNGSNVLFDNLTIEHSNVGNSEYALSVWGNSDVIFNQLKLYSTENVNIGVAGNVVFNNAYIHSDKIIGILTGASTPLKNSVVFNECEFDGTYKMQNIRYTFNNCMFTTSFGENNNQIINASPTFNKCLLIHGLLSTFINGGLILVQSSDIWYNDCIIKITTELSGSDLVTSGIWKGYDTYNTAYLKDCIFDLTAFNIENRVFFYQFGDIIADFNSLYPHSGDTRPNFYAIYGRNVWLMDGFLFFDMSLSPQKPVIYKSDIGWTETDGTIAGILHSGQTWGRPADGRKIYIGFQYMDLEKGKPIFAKSYLSSSPYSVSWVDGDGAKADAARSGTSNNRPVGSDIYIGFQFFDVTIGKPIYASAISGDTVIWVDATGATV